MPPRYLRDYRTELYGQPPKHFSQCAEPAAETSETVLLRQEVAQLKSMMKDLHERVEQYEHGYSEGDSEEDCHPRTTQSSPNQPVTSVPAPQCEKSMSEPNLTESVPALPPGKMSQSVQTLFPYAPTLSAAQAKYNQPRGLHSSRIPFIQRLYLHLKSQPILSHLLTIQVL
ncbi:hypothetical protein JOB18_018190 [Xyrichtys novacula]|uniref:Uncharacterized protein n=1 Tax=Xyrichtys novacula TaxID=13765 RepID=A0AAV1HM26_XYRNO|nr:hypothetical protein JOB18_018190 [Xyrichtys novacula]